MRAEDAEVNAAAEKAAAGFVAAGFPKMPARALMALVSSEDGSLTAAGLADRLGVSAAAVSGAVRYLQTVGFVHRVSQPGSRRDLYALYDDEWYIASMRKSPIYQSLAALTDSTAEALPEGSAARSRVAEMGRFYRFLAARMPALLDDWERQRAGDSRKALSGDVRAGDSRSGEVLSRDALSRDALSRDALSRDAISKGGRP